MHPVNVRSLGGASLSSNGGGSAIGARNSFASTLPLAPAPVASSTPAPRTPVPSETVVLQQASSDGGGYSSLMLAHCFGVLLGNNEGSP